MVLLTVQVVTKCLPKMLFKLHVYALDKTHTLSYIFDYEFKYHLPEFTVTPQLFLLDDDIVFIICNIVQKYMYDGH